MFPGGESSRERLAWQVVENPEWEEKLLLVLGKVGAGAIRMPGNREPRSTAETRMR